MLRLDHFLHHIFVKKCGAYLKMVGLILLFLSIANLVFARQEKLNLNDENFQNQTTISGYVTDKQGPVVGASVLVKNTHNAAVTDDNGAFVLNDLKSGDTIQISSIGYVTQEVIFTNQSTINVVLKEDVELIKEVVVVGYGTQKKANLSGAVASVDSKELQNRPIQNISSGIQGLMPGVIVTSGQGRPGQDGATIRIRGIGTLNSSNPYILVDGVEVGSMDLVDPNDIQNISVLKDASSAAIYGSKASNGVVLITTKRGSTGKPKISYNGYAGVQLPTMLVERVSSADYAIMQNTVLKYEGKTPLYTDADIAKFKDGSSPYTHPNTKWYDLAFKTGFQQQHNVSVSGGSDDSRYMASVGYLNQKGILPNSGRDQFNARTNLDLKILDCFNVRLNMSYINNSYYDPNSTYASGSSDQIIRQLNIISPMIVNKKEDGTYGTTSDGNPIAWLDLNQTIDRLNQNFSGTLAADLEITKGLIATVQGSYVSNNQDYKAFVKDIRYNPTLYHGPNSLTEIFYRWHRASFDAFVNYDKNFGDHNLKLMAGYHAEKYKYKENNAFRKNFPNNILDDMNAGTTSTQTNGGYTRDLAMLSAFGRLNYDYAGKYLFEANFRADASSRFSPDNRWGYFPSFSAAWRVSEEGFMEDAKSWLNDFKIRGSWGLLGNQDALSDFYPWMSIYNIGANYPFSGELMTGYYRGRFNLSTITWEKARTWGIGVDMRLFNNFNFSVEYYDRLTNGIIMDVPVPAEFALSAYKDNVGSMKNSGIEASLGYGNIWGDWSFSANANFTYNKNEILNLGGVDRMISGNTIRKIGEPINSYYAYEADGFFQSQAEIDEYIAKYKKENFPFGKNFNPGDIKYKDTNNDGKIDANDKVILGTSDPKFVFGFNFNLAWKNLDLSAIFTGVAGVYRSFGSELYGYVAGDVGHPSTAWLDAWSETNKNGSMPVLFRYNTSNSDPSVTSSSFWIENSSYVRLKNLQLGYKLPKKWMDAINFTNVRIYYSAENMLTLSGLRVNTDPESPAGRGSHYPLIQSHTFGLNVTF